MLYTEEQIQRANERSISEYFRQAGYSCKRAGLETHIEGFGGFYVNETTIPNKFYIHSQQKGGVGLVNCLMKVMDMPFKEAVRAALDGELGQEERTESVPNYVLHIRKTKPPVPEPKSEFIMPEKGENDHRVFSYLKEYVERLMKGEKPSELSIKDCVLLDIKDIAYLTAVYKHCF